MQDNRISIRKELLILGVLGLVLTNFLGVAIYWSYLLVPLFIFRLPDNLKILDRDLLLVFLFSVLYAICIKLNGISLDELSRTVFIGYILLPAIFYFMGKHLISMYPNKHTVYFLLFFIIIFFSSLPFVANLYSVYEYGFMTERNIRLFWMEENQFTAATNVGSYVALNMSLLPLLFARKFDRFEKSLTLLSGLLFFMGLFAVLNMSNRTGLAITLVSVLVFIIIARNSVLSVLAGIIFIAGVVSLFVFNVWNLLDWLQVSQIYERLSSTSLLEEGSRLLLWKEAIAGIFKHPFGNADLSSGYTYAHNLWLDVGQKAGIIPLLPLLMFTITAIGSIVRIGFGKSYSMFFKTLIVGIGIALFSTIFLEPVMEGFFILFLIFTFYFGILNGIRDYIGPDKHRA